LANYSQRLTYNSILFPNFHPIILSNQPIVLQTRNSGKFSQRLREGQASSIDYTRLSTMTIVWQPRGEQHHADSAKSNCHDLCF